MFTLLHQTSIPPLDPDSIRRLTSALDDVADALNATAETLTIYQIDHQRSEAAEIGDLLVQHEHNPKGEMNQVTIFSDIHANLAPCQKTMQAIVKTIGLFLVAAVWEMSGAYLVW